MLRNRHGISKKVEQIGISHSNLGMPSVALQPKEKVHIPFTYCSLTVQSSQLEVFKVFEFW